MPSKQSVLNLKQEIRQIVKNTFSQSPNENQEQKSLKKKLIVKMSFICENLCNSNLIKIIFRRQKKTISK